MPSCPSSGDSGGGERPKRRCRSCRHRPGVVIDDKIKKSSVRRERGSKRPSSLAAVVVGVKSMDRLLGGSGGVNVHRRCRRSLAVLHLSSSAVVLSGQRRLWAMLLRAVFLRWRSATSFCRLSKKNFLRRRQDAVALAPAVLLCMGLLPPAKDKGGGVPFPMILLLLLLGWGRVDHARCRR